MIQCQLARRQRAVAVLARIAIAHEHPVPFRPTFGFRSGLNPAFTTSGRNLALPNGVVDAGSDGGLFAFGLPPAALALEDDVTEEH